MATLVSRRRARRPLLPLFFSKATFSVYRTTNVEYVLLLLTGSEHGRYGRMAERPGPGTISSHRPVLLWPQNLSYDSHHVFRYSR